jgi:hypothetical protein
MAVYMRTHLCILEAAVVIIVILILRAASLEILILRLVFIICLHAGQACAQNILAVCQVVRPGRWVAIKKRPSIADALVASILAGPAVTAQTCSHP